MYCSEIENTVKEFISLTHPFHKTCFSLRKLYVKKGIWYTKPLSSASLAPSFCPLLVKSVLEGS